MEWLTSEDRRDLVRILTKVDGRRTGWYYDLFDAYNELFFAKRLPTPLITSEICAYGNCLGLTHAEAEAEAIPHIRMHVGLCDRLGRPSENAWGGSVDRNTATFVFLHELTHISQKMDHLKDLAGETSHNARSWVSEANRMSESLDLPRCCRRWSPKRFGKTVKRVPDLDEPTADVLVESLTMKDVSKWPHGVAEVVHPGKTLDWGDGVIKKLGLPRF